MPWSRFLARFPLRVKDLEVLGTHQLPQTVFWVGWLFKNLFCTKAPGQSSIKEIFLCQEGKLDMG